MGWGQEKFEFIILANNNLLVIINDEIMGRSENE